MRCGLRTKRPGVTGRRDDGGCLHSRRQLPDRPVVAPDEKGQPWPVRPGNVDALAVANIHHLHPATVEKHAGRRTVVDRNPFAPIEAQQQMCAGDERMGNPHVGAEVSSHDHVLACREAAL